MDKNPLVEDEGVNAGSADQLHDDRDPKVSAAAVRAGGHPDEAAPVAPVDDLDPGTDGGDSDLLGAPDGDGQDAGSIQ
jgi:hypothetical protein